MPTMQITVAQPYALLSFAMDRLGLDHPFPPESEPMGILRDGRLAAVFVFNAFYDDQCAIHLATDHSRRWAVPSVLRAVFGHPFELRGVRRLNAVVPVANTKTMLTAIKLGFLPEGRMRQGGSDGSDAILLSMLARECRWIDHPEPKEGQ